MLLLYSVVGLRLEPSTRGKYLRRKGLKVAMQPPTMDMLSSITHHMSAGGVSSDERVSYMTVKGRLKTCDRTCEVSATEED